MKKRIIVLAFFCALVIAATAPYAFSASQLSVQKTLKTGDISVGDNVEIMLKFENPFGKPIPLKIIDKNILGGNGVDIQCMEYTIPGQKSLEISYPAIQAFDSGDFTLESVKITYTNPETGKEENITSKEVEVSIKKSAASQNIQQQGITTVYQCNGVSMQSTSYSSSGSSQNQQNQNQNNPQSREQQHQAQNQMQDKLNSMQQQNQNMDQIRQEMQKQAQKEEQTKQEMMKNIESNPDFQKQDQELKKQGYQPSEKTATPGQNQSGESSPNEGSFEYQYKKENGDTASIKGDMQNGTVQNMQKWSSEDEKNAAKGIENSSQFQKLEEELKKQGYQLQNKSITPDANSGQNQNQGANAQQSANQGTKTQQSNNQNPQAQNNGTNQTGNAAQQNATQKTAASFQYNYANPATNATASINGNATISGNTTNITKIDLEKTEEKNNRIWYELLAILIVAAAAYLYYKKTRKAPLVPITIKEKKIKPLDYRKKARRMIEEAEKLFADGLQKDAYVKVSRAVRFYFKHKFDKTEMTSSDILRAIGNENAEYVKNVRECFSTCDLVNFAKYEPNARDFKKVAGLAKEIIV